MGNCGAWLEEGTDLSLGGIHVYRFKLVTPRRRRVITEIGHLAGLSATTFVRIPRLDARGIVARIAFRSVDYSDERESHERVVTAGFALYY
jgi:hypothetical protein